MHAFARVVVNVPTVSGVFDYHIPEILQGTLSVGCLVTIPFGQQVVQGIVSEIIEESQVPNLKDIIDLLDSHPVVNPHQLKLARWLAEQYYASWADYLLAMIPPGLSQQADTMFSLENSLGLSTNNLTPLQKRLIELLKTRGDLRGRQIDVSIPHQNWRAAAKSLIGHGLLKSRSVLPKPTVNRKMIKTAQIACSPQILEAALPTLAKKSSNALHRRQAILRFLIKEAMPVNVSWVYAETGGNLADLHALEERELILLSESEVWRDPLQGLEYQTDCPPQLTPDQESAWHIIQKNINRIDGTNSQKPILIHGVTGSGKTELYLRAVEEVIQRGQQAIILVPEISLTPQTVRRFVARFPGQVGLIHSRLSPGERYDTWRRARNGDISVVVGPRSALFTPFANPGLIVVDECHDGSYYQGEFRPLYHAVEAALAYGLITSANLLLGSATPSVEMYYRAVQENWHIIKMPTRILAHQEAVKKRIEMLRPGTHAQFTSLSPTAASLPLPFVHIVDMREELKAGNRSLFSHSLQNALTETLQSGLQAILFLNRRGSATYVFCRNCGYVVRCPRCELPLTLHTDTAILLCHTCGYQRQPLTRCPQCNHEQIREYGAGTEKVEQLINQQFPHARVLRWDADTTRQRGAEDILLSHFINHRADILIGTQMLAKGLDMPFVTLVGVVLADVGLNFPDYRASERTFQLLAQVAGRAGRSLLGGKVILQTFQPFHYAIQRAAEHDFEGFYKMELENRARLGYPPFNELVRLETSDLKWEKAKERAESMAVDLMLLYETKHLKGIDVIGPTPAFFSRVSGYYRWQIILRGKGLRELLVSIKKADWKVEVDPPDLL